MGAQERGADITTEAYPYTAVSTALQSSIFDEGWQDRLRISFGDLQWQDTGERLTEESFRRYREQGGVVIIHMMRPEWIEAFMADPRIMVASDGMPYAPGAHPDLTLFDPQRIIDTATFEDGLSYSEGIEHVLVNGRFVVRDGAPVEEARPGRAILGRGYVF